MSASTPSGSALTREAILRALGSLSEELGKQGVTGELCLFMRPKTLAEVAALAAEGDSFDRCLANFLDEFYAAPAAASLSTAPALLGPRFGELGRRARCLPRRDRGRAGPCARPGGSGVDCG